MAVESPITPERERELLSCGESPRLRTCSDDDDARLLDHLVRVLCSSRLGRRTRDDHKLARLGSGGKRSWLLSCPHLRGFVLKLASLLGIILVAQQSSRNPHIVYSYPPSPQAVPRTSKPIYPSARRAAARSVYIPSPTSSSSSSSSDSSDEETDDADADAVHKRLSTEQYLGFSDGILAELLSPNRELCDQPFELVVDHLAFVGHPVWLGLGDEEPARREADVAEDDGVEVERGRSRRRKAERGGGPLGGGAVEDREKTVAPPLISRTSSEPPNLSRASSGSPASPIKLVRSPSSSSSLIPWSSLASSQQSHTSIHGASRLISFNLLCVIDTPPDSHLSSHLEGFYKDVVVPVTANIKALERKGKWLGKEAAKLRRARENYVEKGSLLAPFSFSLADSSPRPNSRAVPRLPSPALPTRRRPQPTLHLSQSLPPRLHHPRLSPRPSPPPRRSPHRNRSLPNTGRLVPPCSCRCRRRRRSSEECRSSAVGGGEGTGAEGQAVTAVLEDEEEASGQVRAVGDALAPRRSGGAQAGCRGRNAPLAVPGHLQSDSHVRFSLPLRIWIPR